MATPLPKQVEAQLKEVEKLEEQLRKNQELPKSDEPAELKAETPEAKQVAQPEAKPVEAEANETEVKKAKPEPVETPKQEDWQQKYRTLKGMYDAEVPRLHTQVKELTKQMDELRKQKEAPTPVPQPAVVEKLVTDEEVNEFGADLIEVQRKVAREVANEFRAELAELKAENTKLREELSGTGSKVAEASFDTKLHRLVPDFDAINADPDWISWLEEQDPILRGPRKIVAQEAFNRGDADGVAYYVELFKKTKQPVEPPKKSSNNELELQVQPTRNASTAPKQSQTGRSYTSADITKMFKQAAELSARGKIEEAIKLEAEIDAAYRDNRVAV